MLPMGNSGIKRKLGWLELGLYIGGAALIAVFLYVRADAGRQAAEGIEAFQQTVARQVTVPDPEGGEQFLATGSNERSWSVDVPFDHFGQNTLPEMVNLAKIAQNSGFSRLKLVRARTFERKVIET